MGIKIFDLPPGGLKDGAVASFNGEESDKSVVDSLPLEKMSEPNKVIEKSVEVAATEITDDMTEDDIERIPVRGEIVVEQTSPEDPPQRKYVTYDKLDRIVSSDPEGTPEFAAATGVVGEMRAALKTMIGASMLRVELPEDVVEELNQYIDDEVIPADVSASEKLVGQIKSTDKSKQLVFDLNSEAGGSFKTVLDKLGKTFVSRGFGADVVVDTFEAWTVHSYTGDYNPLHNHGCHTMAGLSCILYLKVPECIQNAIPPAEHGESTDGLTYFNWGQATSIDIDMLRPVTEEYVKPEAGTMLIFPSWLKHAVMPFSGEGERRTFSANMNVFKMSEFDGMSEEQQIAKIEKFRG